MSGARGGLLSAGPGEDRESMKKGANIPPFSLSLFRLQGEHNLVLPLSFMLRARSW